jgi:hypothetical protein
MAASDDSDGEWRFSLEDLDGDEGPESDDGGNIAGTLTPDGVVEPQEIDPENAFFVLVGVLLAALFVGAVVAAL